MTENILFDNKTFQNAFVIKIFSTRHDQNFNKKNTKKKIQTITEGVLCLRSELETLVNVERDLQEK